MYITEERHTVYYRNPAMKFSWFMVQLIWCDGDNVLIPDKSYDGTFWSRFSNGVRDLDNVFENKYVVCNPSVRREVKREFEDYLSYCGIGMCLVIKEAHAFYISAGEAEYIVNFEGIPGRGRVQCSVEQDERVVNMGTMDIDIIHERELLQCACSIFKH